MLRVASRVLVNAPRERVSIFLKDLKTLPSYDTWVSSVEVNHWDPEKAEVSACGSLLGFQWRDMFQVVFAKDGGYRWAAALSHFGRYTSSYELRSSAGGTVVVHEESYDLPFFVDPLLLLAKRWVARSIELELRALKEGAEHLDRRLSLKEIESHV